MKSCWTVLSLLLPLWPAARAADYRPPAETRPAVRRPSAASILPGGRAIVPAGKIYATGPGPFGLAMNAKGTMVVSADGGPNRYALTVLDRAKDGWRLKHEVAPRSEKEEDDDEEEWRSVFMGLAFVDEREVWAAEGESGQVRLVDLRGGKHKQRIDLNQGEFRDSYSGDIAYDPASKRLYVLDQANFRLAIVDTPSRKVVSSVRVGRLPFSLALSPDRKRVYVAHIGMFEYKAVPGADTANARQTGLPFPAFGFPSPEALSGVERQNASGQTVAVAGLGDPNARESNSVAVVDVSAASPAEAKVVDYVRTGLPFGGRIAGGSSPSGIVAADGRVYVSNGNNDTIAVIDSNTLEVTAEIALRIPGLEPYRGILPIGLYYDASTGWLLVACAGINAIAVIDTRSNQVAGYIPTAWFPTRVLVRDGQAWVTCAKGQGTGPNATRNGRIPGSFLGEHRRGAINSFPLPDAADLPKLTGTVFAANGFLPQPRGAAPLPPGIEHVVIILKENRTFDEVFGDIETASNGAVAGIPILARFGKYGVIRSEAGTLSQRLNLRNLQVTPNHHAMAARFSFSDNFYTDSEVSVDGHHWIVGSYPNAWTESTLMAAYGGQKKFKLSTAPGRLLFAESNSSLHPEEQLENGALWHHLDRHGISFRNFGEGFELAGVDEGAGLKPTGGRYVTNVPMPDPLYRNSSRNYPNFNMNIPDQFRATQFINEMEELYVKPGKPLPRLLFLHLPNDHMAEARPEDGYPFDASFVADNDYALGRIVEYLSNSPWWPKMAILVTEDDSQGGIDHIDSHRTVFLAISPYARRNYVSHTNSSFPGLLKTVFRLLRIPPLNLFDATAADLADCFQETPDLEPYKLLPVPTEIFEPANARDPLDPKPSPRMDDPRVIREQQRRERQ